MFVVASERKDAWPDDQKKATICFLPINTPFGAGESRTTEEHDPDRAATAIVDDRIVAPVHGRDEHIGSLQPIRVNGKNPV